MLASLVRNVVQHLDGHILPILGRGSLSKINMENILKKLRFLSYSELAS